MQLHLLWRPTGDLFVWGEDPTGSEPPAQGPDAPVLRAPPPHPFGLASQDLAVGLGGRLPAASTPGEELLLLPTTRGVPAPPDPDGPTYLDRWSVQGLALPLREVLERLTAGLPPSPSWRAAGELARFAADLVARGRFVPGLTGDDWRPRSCWSPLLADAADRERARELAAAAPPIWGALYSGSPYAPPDTWRRTDPVRVARELLAALVDELVREALERDPPPLPSGLQPAEAAWLRGLLARLPPRSEQAQQDAQTLKEVAPALREWAERAVEPARAQYRVTLRIESPSGSDDLWRVHPALEARDGDAPRLELPALRRARDAGGEAGSAWDTLVEGLRAAAGVLPALDPAGLEESAGPEGGAGQDPAGGDLGPGTPGPSARDHLALTAAEAHSLLVDLPEVLARRQVGVEVPGWLRARALGLRARVRPGEASGGEGHLGLQALCAVEWGALLGDRDLDPDELRTLVESKRPLVRLGAEWVALDDSERAALARLLKGEGRRDAALVEALRLAAGLDDPPVGLPLRDVQGQEWVGGLLGGAAVEAGGEGPGGARGRSSEGVEAGPSFQGTLRPYQGRGVGWIEALEARGLGACLADDMGLGKTVQVLAMLSREEPAAARTSLLVSPLSVVANWVREARRFLPTLRVLVHHGADRLRGEALAEACLEHDLVVTTYGLLARDREDLERIPWHRLVLDEAQNIKNADTRTARAARALPAARRVALSGTPVENRLEELWSLMAFLVPGLLGKRGSFRSRFARPIEQGGDTARAEALRKLVAPFVLRRRKSDPGIAPELPEKLEAVEACALTREQAALYQAATDEALETAAGLAGMARRGLILGVLTRLKQICNHPEQLLKKGGRLEGRSGKLARLEELLEEIFAVDERVLVFTQYREMGELLARRIQDRFEVGAPFLHGGVSAKARQRMVDEFQSGVGPPVLLLSLKAGGTGLTLTAASHVVHYDRWWNPAVEEQATDRAYRIGQTRRVLVHKLMAAGTLEERIDRMLAEKKALADSIVTSGETWITELDDDALRDLLVLGGDAVVGERGRR